MNVKMFTFVSMSGERMDMSGERMDKEIGKWKHEREEELNKYINIKRVEVSAHLDGSDLSRTVVALLWEIVSPNMGIPK